MPSTSAKQAKFMRAIAHSPSFAKKVGVKQAVGKDFEMADKKKMRKFSEGGALGKYNRRMADIEKDFKKDSKGKSGRALEVLAAKRAQRTADAEDDRAKRTGADRTATRAAEKAAEANLTKTRRFGADKPVKAYEPVKAAEPVKASTPEPVKAAEPAKAKPQSFNEAFKAARAEAVKAGRDPNKEIFTWGGKKKVALMASKSPKPVKRTNNSAGASSSSTNNSADAAPAAAPAAAADKSSPKPKTPTTTGGTFLRGRPGGTPLISGTDTRAFITYGDAAARNNSKAKGGKLKKESNMKKAVKGEKAKAKGKNSFMATKFGAAMMKKSADTEGRAMKKFAKGGSIDGCAQRGKTKTKRVAMKSGGSC